ncbi:histidine kinase [Actinokineospora guangxiensis]|uniref:Histidine kinase n=1 Tax=Actinokineospora guangxiensis TaxID=1490288 RepID=A0ABW0EJM6_9PSEU
MPGPLRALLSPFRARPHRLRAPDRDTAELRCALERALHDGPALRASALALELGLLAVTVTDPVERKRLDAAQDTVQDVIDDLRAMGEVLYPPVLAGSGLEPALRAVAERQDLAMTIDMAVDAGGLDPREHSRVCLLVADHLRSLEPGTAVAVRVRGGRRFVRVRVTAAGRVGWAVIRCG